MKERDRILCSAIKVEGAGEKWDDIYLGLRHVDCFRAMTRRRALLDAPDVVRLSMIRNNIQGFWTTGNRFVNRVQAYGIAKYNNQIVKEFGNGKELYSECLY